MKKIFIQTLDNIKGETVKVTGKDYSHLAKSLRVKVGDNFIIGNNSNQEFLGRIVNINKSHIDILLGNILERNTSSLPDVTLFFSILKGDKNESIIQKCSEIGVNKFVPVLAKNCIVKLDKGSLTKVERWKKIARESAMQSGRASVPEVHDIIPFEEVNTFKDNECRIFGYISKEAGDFFELIEMNKNKESFYLFVGPEGDFTQNEIKVLINNNWHGVNISPYIFKSDTASIFFVSLIFGYFWKPGIV